MRIMSGTVHDGHIVVEDADLAEGEKVTVLTCEGTETFRVSRRTEERFGVFRDSTDLWMFAHELECSPRRVLLAATGHYFV